MSAFLPTTSSAKQETTTTISQPVARSAFSMLLTPPSMYRCPMIVIGGHTPGIAALEATARSSVCSLSRILRKRDRMASSSAGSTSYIVGWCVRRIVSYSSWLRMLRSNLHGTDIPFLHSVLGAHVKKDDGYLRYNSLVQEE